MEIKQLLTLSEDILTNAKIHFAIGMKDKLEPLYTFYDNRFQEWQETQNNKNFELPFIVSLIYYKKDEWLYAGVYKRIALSKISKIPNRFRYITELQDISSDLIGRLVIKYKKSFRQSYPFLINHIDNLELLEILRERYTTAPFPGYNNVNIKFELLKTVISQQETSWKTALSIVKGIYLISDISNGKLYVGSAYGQQAFWNRWQEYIKNGHGGNMQLKALIDQYGIEYTNNFQFSILETRSMNAEDDEIIKRESFWKDILLSRQFGYNKN